MAKRRWIIGVVVVAGLAVLALWPLEPRLEWYTSNAFWVAGRPIRVRALVPSNWTDLDSKKAQKPQITNGSIRHAREEVSISQAVRMEWIPKWIPSRLRRLFLDDERLEPDAAVFLMIDAPGLYESTPVLARQFDGLSHARRDYYESGKAFAIVYVRNNRAEFDATYRQICESFRVIREK
jgi:hypothetical protein